MQRTNRLMFENDINIQAHDRIQDPAQDHLNGANHIEDDINLGHRPGHRPQDIRICIPIRSVPLDRHWRY